MTLMGLPIAMTKDRCIIVADPHWWRVAPGSRWILEMAGPRVNRTLWVMTYQDQCCDKPGVSEGSLIDRHFDKENPYNKARC